jgi:hypothetical protein
LKEAVHRYNSESNLRQRILSERTGFDTSESNLWDVAEQMKLDSWIHQCHQACRQERLYHINKNPMTETKDKIIYQNKSIEKDELFARSDRDWKIARVEMMMTLTRKLNISILEAHRLTLQLRPERESFYSII